MQELLNTLLATLQALMVLLAAQGGTLPPEATALLSQASAVAPQVQASHGSPISFTDINKTKADAVVNILCKGSGKLKSGTATSVIISPTGLMLANAHIAQYMLLEQESDAPVSCTIRTGSPARDSYKAEVIYIPPAWVAKHGSQVTRSEQRGTGEDDYAILQITEAINHNPRGTPPALPSTFTYITPNASELTAYTGTNALIRAYPAELVGSQITLYSLHPMATITNIKEVSTFSDANTGEPITRDLISLGGNILAQGGSSGGAIIDNKAKLIGLVVTSTRTEQTKDRDLRAITLSHINSSIKKYTGESLSELIDTPTSTLYEKFQAERTASAQVLAEFINN